MNLSTKLFLTNIVLLFCNLWMAWKLHWWIPALCLPVPMFFIARWGKQAAREERESEIRRLRNRFRVLRGAKK